MAKSAKWAAVASAEREHPEVLGADLPSRIRYEHEQAGVAFQRAVEHAVRCGQLLAEAKAQVKHGEWGTWLDEHFPASRRTAQGYMRLAAHAEDAQRLAHLGVAGALNELAAPKASSGRLGAAAESIAAGDEFANAHDSYFAYMFGCELPLPDRIRQAIALLVKAKEDGIGGTAMKESLEAAMTSDVTEIARLVPEFDDLAWRVGFEERAAEALQSIREVLDVEGEQ